MSGKALIITAVAVLASFFISIADSHVGSARLIHRSRQTLRLWTRPVVRIAKRAGVISTVRPRLHPLSTAQAISHIDSKQTQLWAGQKLHDSTAIGFLRRLLDKAMSLAAEHSYSVSKRRSCFAFCSR
jgi:hypothetical protein